MTKKIIPRVDFQVNKGIMQTFFFPEHYGGKRDRFDADVEAFKELLSPYEERILTLIEKFSGFAWSKERIPVIFFPKNQIFSYSFTRPGLEKGLPGILQKIVPEQQGRIFHIFVHELTHVNQMQSDFRSEKYGTVVNGERNTDMIELGADLVTLHILRELFGKDSTYETDYWDFMQNTNEKNKSKFEQLKKYEDWDLNKNTLEYYLRTCLTSKE